MDTLIKNLTNKEIDDNDIDTFLGFVINDRRNVVQALLEKGVRADLTDRARQTALAYAIDAAKADMVQLLIKYGANVEAKIVNADMTMLMLASIKGYTEIAELLLIKGAKTEVNDNNNMTALMHAADDGHRKTVQLLIRLGANIETIGLDGKTALIFAVSRGHVEVVKELILLGANVQAVSKIRKKSVIMYAARAGKTEVVDVLIQAGANIRARDSDDLTALNHAANNKHISTAYRLLCSYSLKERDEFTIDSPENLYLVDNFNKELYRNQEKIYLIIRTPYKLKVNHEKECHFSFFPLEIINFIKLLEVKLQCFPDWYQHRVESDINLAFALKVQALMTPAYDAKKKESANNIKEDSRYDQDINNDLNDLDYVVSKMKLN